MLMENCGTCGCPLTTIGCPEGQPGCCVAHYGCAPCMERAKAACAHGFAKSDYCPACSIEGIREERERDGYG
jgi:hypothetical protein